jgi:hypothetical protein
MLDDYIKLVYAKHDIAHNIDHVMKVKQNARDIIKYSEGHIKLNSSEEKIFDFVMLMHDARDHKLVEKGCCRPAEEIRQIAVENFGDHLADVIEHIHNNCSWSKCDSSSPEIRDLLRKLLQDADWFEAIGEGGLQRCRDYTIETYPDYSSAQVEERVKTHINEKLIHIYARLNFTASRKLADDRGLHLAIVNYL